MVNVRVRKDHRIHLRRVKTEAAIDLVGLGARTLEEPAVEQDIRSIDLQQML